MMPKKRAPGNGRLATRTAHAPLDLRPGAQSPRPRARTVAPSALAAGKRAATRRQEVGDRPCPGKLEWFGPRGLAAYGYTIGRPAASHAASPPAISLTSVKP